MRFMQQLRLRKFTSTFFNRDHVVFTIASRKPALRLSARISRVLSVIVKHVVSMFSRTRVSFDLVDILMGYAPQARQVFYAWWPGKFSYFWLLFISRVKRSSLFWQM